MAVSISISGVSVICSGFKRWGIRTPRRSQLLWKKELDEPLYLDAWVRTSIVIKFLPAKTFIFGFEPSMELIIRYALIHRHVVAVREKQLSP